jgi:hypothetical protein
LHDLICRTFVLRADAERALQLPSIARIHYGVIGTIAVLWIVVSLVIQPQLERVSPFAETLPILEAVSEMNGVSGASVIRGQTFGPRGSATFLEATVIWRGEPESYQGAIDEVARLVLATYPRLNEIDVMVVQLKFGYDIGIASSWRSYARQFSPAEWRSRLA